ncbi:hypothetical protein FN846DRAFT_911071 [Sphaerosporella brunnea]|uniref:Uncharacterized protein n=1 Tax=Sphaerosporella brunnea TaxID=1250544 RepID=A0A5J5EMX0_9PEZI|nr:hypothetical protein FN846DRAFT_911071 [Sphaerosporella brunnea]
MKADIELALLILGHKDNSISITPEAFEYALSFGTPVIVTAAMSNHANKTQALELVMDNGNADRSVFREGFKGSQKITDEIVKKAAVNWVNGKELMEGLANRDGVEFDEAAMEPIARHFDENTMRSILRRHSNIQITKDMLVAAAGNQRSGVGVMRELLGHSSGVEVDATILKTVAINEV